MIAEFHPFKNGEHNYEITSTIDRGITPLTISSLTQSSNRLTSKPIH